MMDHKKLNSLLDLSSKSKFIIIDEKGKYLPIEENAKGEVKDVVAGIGKELFGQWPLNEEDEKRFQRLTSLRFRPTKKVASKK